MHIRTNEPTLAPARHRARPQPTGEWLAGEMQAP
jgi:hypothetical protein